MSAFSNPMNGSSTGLPTACLSALVAALGLAAAGAAHSAGPLVPWLDQPALEQASAMQAATVASRPCAESDLKIRLGGQGARRGHATQEVLLTNKGSQACYLVGAPGLQLVTPRGVAQAMSVNAMAPHLTQRQIDLAPDEDAVILVGAPGSCDAAVNAKRNVATRIKLLPLGGGTVTLDGAHIDTLCGPATVLHVDVVHDEAKQQAKMARMAGGGAPLSQLTGTVAVPEAVGRGSTLHYTVTLSNSTDAAVPLTPCPVYTQALYTEGHASSKSFRLNCKAAGGQIPPQSSVSFEMKMPVPATMTGEGVKLSWSLENGPTVGTITPLR